MVFLGSSLFLHFNHKKELTSEANSLLKSLNQILQRNLKDLGIASKISGLSAKNFKKNEAERIINDLIFDKQEIKEMYLVGKAGEILSQNTKTHTGLFLENESPLKAINPQDLLFVEDETLGQYWTLKKTSEDSIILGKNINTSKDSTSGSRKIFMRISVSALINHALATKSLTHLINHSTQPSSECAARTTLLSQAKICISLNSKSIIKWKIKSFSLLLLFISLLGIITFLFFVQLEWRLIRPNKFFLRLIGEISNGKDSSLLLQNIPASLRGHKGSLENLMNAVKDASTINMSKQVAHDIRSPLSALKLITHDLTQIPEERKALLKAALQRIQDISNNLLIDSKKVTDTNKKNNLIELPLCLENIIAEKRIQYTDKKNIEFNVNIQNKDNKIFIQGEEIEFGRLISNLVDNSVEAIGSKNGTIQVDLSSKNHELLLLIEDNGTGIPEEFINKIGSRGATFGKSNGSGLGIFHAKSSIESWNGKFLITSSLKHGTKIEITLPLAGLSLQKRQPINTHASC